MNIAEDVIFMVSAQGRPLTAPEITLMSCAGISIQWTPPGQRD